MSSSSARLSLCTSLRKNEEADKMEVMHLVWGTNRKWVALRAQCGRVKAKLGRRRQCEQRSVAGCMGPGGKVTLFLQECEFAKVAFSCHMAWT